MNPFAFIIVIAAVLAGMAMALGHRKRSDYIFYLSIGVLGGSLYVLLPSFNDGEVRSLGSIRAIFRLGVVMGAVVFFAILFRSQKR